MSNATYEALLYEVRDTTALVTLHRPERLNAWNAIMAAELAQALRAAEADDDVRAVVITGAGRAFCAGADLERGGDTFAGREGRAGAARERPVETLPYMIGKPVIAAINGAAVGVGMTYPMLCDIRLASEDAKLGFVFTRRGMMPELGSHLLVQRVAGFANAADLLMSGRIFPGSEAARLGVVNRAVPKDELLDTALAMAAEYRLAAPVSVAITKRLLWEGLETGLAAMRARENPLFAWVGNQADAREGVVSFVEKREPQWSLSAGRNLPEQL
jgi:enoyl-CoA hydratase/carnithine racemase